MSFLDYLDGTPSAQTVLATVEPDGVTRARLTPPQPQFWLVYRITVQSTVQGEAYVYVGEPSIYTLVSGTYSGEFDENETSVPYVVPIGTPIVIEWPAGGECLARIEYVETN